MRIFKTRWFARWADGERLSDSALRATVDEIAHGLVDANLGGHIFKKRVAIPGRGKSGGLRTLLAFKSGERVFFLYGFAKSACANVSNKELLALKVFARKLLDYDARALQKAMVAGELYEITNHD
jgi:hypothetical protein